MLEAGEAMILEETLAERTYLTTKSPLRDEQGRVIGLIGVATDITERKQAQRELEKLVVAEQRLRAEAERANRAKDEFLAIVSHELRSPLNALRGWSHLLATTRPLEQSLVERAAKAIKRNVDHQTRLIDDLLDTSRIVSGKLTIERRAVNLVEIVLAALDAARPGAAAKEIDLRFTPDDATIMVVGDGGRLQQLASNLLSNAVKFTPERGAIAVLLLKNAERVQLQVKDNGIGIAAGVPAARLRPLHPGGHVRGAARRRPGHRPRAGAPYRAAARRAGARRQRRAWAAARPSPSSCRRRRQARCAQPVPVPGAPRTRYEGALAGVRVWMLDDDPTRTRSWRSPCARPAPSWRAPLPPPSSPRSSSACCPTTGRTSFLVDLAMPGEDGFEALRRVRSLEMASGVERHIPAIALTAFTQVEREKLLAAGFVDRVDKPVDAEQARRRNPQRRARDPPRRNARRLDLYSSRITSPAAAVLRLSRSGGKPGLLPCSRRKSTIRRNTPVGGFFSPWIQRIRSTTGIRNRRLSARTPPASSAARATAALCVSTGLDCSKRPARARHVVCSRRRMARSQSRHIKRGGTLPAPLSRVATQGGQTSSSGRRSASTPRNSVTTAATHISDAASA